jgi:putative transposase
MRYAQRGGYTPAEQQRRERLRLEAAGRFARGDSTPEIAADLRVTERTVRRWRQAWRDGGAAALRSRGPVSRERLSPWQWARLELELGKGPLAHGFAGDQRWTLGRIKTLIGKLFHVGYTVEGTWRLLRQHGWSCQVPVRYRPGDRPHLFCQLGAYRRRKGEPKGFTWADYRDLIITAHRQLAAPLVWGWDNLNIHLAPELADFAQENAAWLRIYRLPACAPHLNPAEMSLPQCEVRRSSYA